MSEQQNLQIVQGIYESFGRGDMPAVLNALAEDVRWTVQGPDTVPYFGERRGRDGVNDFFVKLGTTVEFERFEVRDFIARDARVVVFGSERGRVRQTGKSFDNDWVMVYTLGDGKIKEMFSYENTAAVVEAFRP